MNAFHLSPAQEKKARKEINALLMNYDRCYWLDMDAAVMWALHEEFGFGAGRLRRFFDRFTEIHKEMQDYYQLDNAADIWLCRHKLKEEVGVDIDAWEREHEQKNGQNTK